LDEDLAREEGNSNFLSTHTILVSSERRPREGGGTGGTEEERGTKDQGTNKNKGAPEEERGTKDQGTNNIRGGQQQK
jgi:hypothetical protein